MAGFLFCVNLIYERFKVFYRYCSVIWFQYYCSSAAFATIGINTLPANSATLCYPPYYTGSFYTSGYQVGNTVNDFKLYNLLGDSLILSEELQKQTNSLMRKFLSGVEVKFQQKPSDGTYGSSISVFGVYTIELIQQYFAQCNVPIKI
ncbi:MAG: hypothetical protein IPG08_07290 [Sphingobacteriaceae bacterium]|nr:hypothetical protein [Sphingobacteriaceae bacterium]